MTTEPTRTTNQSRVRSFLGEAAGGCGGALNSLFAVLGAKDEPVVAAQEETAFMALVCHVCAAATDSHVGTPRSPRGQL